ncbi:MAG: S-methyl-5-thioribose kinase [Rhizobiaceae bacterium]
MPAMETPEGYRPLDEAGVREFLAGLPAIASRLGGQSAGWTMSEVGDGNLNVVYLVDGPDGSVCVKQSLPYVRVAGESWPLPLERTFFENAYYRHHGAALAGLVPEVYHYEPALFAIVMERLSPHIILRRGLIAGSIYPTMAQTIGAYVARASYGTSDLALSLDDKFAGVAEFAANNALRRITAELIFTHPYRVTDRNRWTSPQLDDLALAIRSDAELKAAAAWRGHQFLTNAQALIHGDLHTGSIMVTADDTRVIDPEFAIYGPIGFDLGALLANLLMSYFSQPGHETRAGERREQSEWLLAQVPVFWNAFADTFTALWKQGNSGDAYPAVMLAGDASSDIALERLLAELFDDMLGFAGAKTMRRIFGFAHNADFELIADNDRRAACERRAVTLARRFLVEPGSFRTAADIVAAAREAAQA